MSISTNTLLYQIEIFLAFNSRVQMNFVYTNLKKVFDEVNHKLLLSKLKLFGFHGQYLNWIIL